MASSRKLPTNCLTSSLAIQPAVPISSEEPGKGSTEIKEPQPCDNYSWPRQQTLSCSDFRRVF